MKRSLKVLVLLILGAPFMVQAGGIMTNTNQSASFIRLPVLNAVIGPEGGYYNPAGLSFLQDGFHVSLSNQTIAQRRTINSTFPGMNRSEFEGTVSAPVFPSAYLTYKRGPLAFSVGMNPIGGGGSALFEEGLPSFEQQVSILPGMLNMQGIPATQYDFSTNFDAQSLFWGFQGTVSYALNDMISVSAGLRYVSATNTYSGYLRDIQINPVYPMLGLDGSSMTSAPAFFGNLAGLANAAAQGLTGGAQAMQALIDNQVGNVELRYLVNLGVLTQADIDALNAGFALFDPSANPLNMTAVQIQGSFQTAAGGYAQQRNQLLAFQTLTQNKEVDVTQRGSSLSPIFGIHLKLMDNLDIGIKYEHRTNLRVKNETATDDLGVYPDGLEIANNLPSMLSVGASFGATDRLRLHTGMHYYFDKSAEYGKVKSWSADGTPTFYSNSEIIDKNFWEAGIGAEYQISPMLLVSAGYLRTQTGVNELYQNDQSHSLSTNTLGAGFKVQLNDMIALNLGGLYTQYITHEKEFMSAFGFPYSETYDRSNMVFAIGVDLKF